MLLRTQVFKDADNIQGLLAEISDLKEMMREGGTWDAEKEGHLNRVLERSRKNLKSDSKKLVENYLKK